MTRMVFEFSKLQGQEHDRKWQDLGDEGTGGGTACRLQEYPPGCINRYAKKSFNTVDS